MGTACVKNVNSNHGLRGLSDEFGLNSGTTRTRGSGVLEIGPTLVRHDTTLGVLLVERTVQAWMPGFSDYVSFRKIVCRITQRVRFFFYCR